MTGDDNSMVERERQERVSDENIIAHTMTHSKWHDAHRQCRSEKIGGGRFNDENENSAVMILRRR